MIGRGLLTNPALAQEAHGGQPITREALQHFHDQLFYAYLEAFPENVSLIRMRVIMNHLACCFVEPKKALKAIRKSNSKAAYLQAIHMLFDEQELCATPRYYGPDDLNY